MQFPLWKKILSYLITIPIESTGSEVNQILDVVLSKGRVQLSSENAIYSFEDLYSNFDLLFDKIDLKTLDGSKVLILGFGLGSIPILLEKKGVQVNSFLGIEIDEEVLILANKYSSAKIKAPIQLVCADAQHFVRSCSDKFDLVLIDVFLDDYIPEPILSAEFLEHLKAILMDKDSKVIMNTMYNDEKARKLSSNYYKTVFEKAFEKSRFIDVHMNRMILNF